MAFYGDLLGLEINPERPEDKLPTEGRGCGSDRR